MKYIFVIILSLILMSLNVNASEKFSVEGNTLIYDTENVTNEEAGIIWDDAEELASVLLENQSVRILQLNSGGGDLETAYYMSDLIIDYGLDTNVIGECSSACTVLLIAGERRTVQKGSWVGFHQSYWDAGSMKDWYNQNKEYEGWDDEFEFAEWLYTDTQEYIFNEFQYLLERGIDPLFAIKTMKAESDDMWYPRRKELISANVITD
jgi:hypothetical protein